MIPERRKEAGDLVYPGAGEGLIMCQRFVNHTVQRSLSCFFRVVCRNGWHMTDVACCIAPPPFVRESVVRYRKVFNQAGRREKPLCQWRRQGRTVRSGGESGQVYATKQSQPFCPPAPQGWGWAQAGYELIGYVQSPCSAMEAAFA